MAKFAITKQQQLVEDLKAVNDELAALKSKRQKLIDKLSSTGKDRVEGLLHYATISESEREQLVPVRVKKLLTPAQYKKCLQVTPVTTVRVYSK